MNAIKQLHAELATVPIRNLPRVLASIRAAKPSTTKAATLRLGEPALLHLARLTLDEHVSMDALCDAIVREAVARSEGNVSAAARLVGLDRKAMERRVRRARRAK